MLIFRETIALSGDRDVVAARRCVGQALDKIGASLLRRTRMVTAVSEIARNTVIHGGGGELEITAFNDHPSRVETVFTDSGPGIADVARALSDGYTTGNGMGLGLGGAKRLVGEFIIEGQAQGGTRVKMVGFAR